MPSSSSLSSSSLSSGEGKNAEAFIQIFKKRKENGRVVLLLVFIFINPVFFWWYNSLQLLLKKTCFNPNLDVFGQVCSAFSFMCTRFIPLTCAITILVFMKRIIMFVCDGKSLNLFSFSLRHARSISKVESTISEGGSGPILLGQGSIISKYLAI